MFTSLLDVLGIFLDRVGIDFVQCAFIRPARDPHLLTVVHCFIDDGRMNEKERVDALDAIADDPKSNVILISMKVGGVGALLH